MRLTTMAQFFVDKNSGWKPGSLAWKFTGFVDFLDTRLAR